MKTTPTTPATAPAPSPARIDLQAFVERARAAGSLVVQPRMGMSDPTEMRRGLYAVAAARATAAGTITVDSYTRVRDLDAAREAVRRNLPLNGYPIATHSPETTRGLLARIPAGMPVQVRHGSADPRHVFAAMTAAGLHASEGGPVSYCLPYSRTPLTEAIAAWSEACARLAEDSERVGRRAHLETFGGCMLGQLCPPSLLIALSVLEAMFFVQHGLTSVSLSYAQQTHPVQDIEALAALDTLAGQYLPRHVARHIVLYTYMGVYPRTAEGARLLLESSAQIAVRGGAERLIVKTTAEAHHIPTVAQNIEALERAGKAAARARGPQCALPWAAETDFEPVYREAKALIDATLQAHEDIGTALSRSFAAGILDVPYCLHSDNAGRARARIAENGRLVWATRGSMPLPRPHAGSLPRAQHDGPARPVTAEQLLSMLYHTAERHDRAALPHPRRPALGS